MTSRRFALLASSLALPVVTGLGLSAPMTATAQTVMFGGPSAAGMPSCAYREIELARDTSASIDFPNDVLQAAVTAQTVADVQPQTPRRFSVRGVAVGRTDATFYDAYGQCALKLAIRIIQDTDEINRVIAKITPTARVRAESVGNIIVLSGEVASAAQQDTIVKIAQGFVARPEQVLSNLHIAGGDQVMLSVKVVEVNRTIIKQLGFNTQAIFGQIGGDQYSIGISPNYAVNGGFQGGAGIGALRNTTRQPLASGPDTCASSTTIDITNPANCVGVDRAGAATGLNNGSALLQWFERQGAVRTVSENSLTSVSGEAAQFLSGGEYPVPAGRDNQGNISIEYKSYGVGLGFTPVVLSGGRISLKTSIEVSQLSAQGALTLAGVAGSGTSTVIPGLSVNRTSNVVELPSGGAMMIAGLLREQTNQNIDKIPGLGDLPVVGALGRSRDLLKEEKELVVIITPYLVDPVSPGQLQTPADGLRIADDASTIAFGSLNQAYRAPAGDPPTALAGRRYEGPIGHVID